LIHDGHEKRARFADANINSRLLPDTELQLRTAPSETVDSS